VSVAVLRAGPVRQMEVTVAYGRDDACRDQDPHPDPRQQLGVDERDREQIRDGERVQFLVFDQPQGWKIRAVGHADHPPPPLPALADDRVDQAAGVANVDVGGGHHRLRNVEVVWRSPPGEGGELSITDQHGRKLTEAGRQVALPVGAPHPMWPGEEREWLAGLLEEHSGSGDGPGGEPRAQ